jgi:hypothetical protein
MGWSVWSDFPSGREAVTEDEVLSFIETASDEEGELWYALRRRRAEQEEIGTLSVMMRVIRVAVWLAAGVVMVVGMLMR